ncbi:MAG: hypothetical protein J6O51_09075 [Bacteroidales bacterium]|nr:hypothetical protein [Bacteroidales bacterium]
MKSKLILVSALVICACSPVKTDLEKYSLNCNAQEVTLQSDTLELPYTVTFNKYGQAETVRTDNFDGSFRYEESYTYNDRHQLTDILGVNSENENEARYEYDYKGRFISECRVYGMNNQEMSRWVHKNDGRHIVNTEYYSEGELSFISKKEYSGNSYVEKSYSPEGDLLGTADVSFLTDEKLTRIKGGEFDVEIDYNEKALPVRSRGTLLNSVGEMMWSSDLEQYPERFYSYEYDDKGNWVTRYEKVHPDSTAYSVLHRIIRY